MAISSELLLKRVRKQLDDEPWEDFLSSGYTAASGQVSVNQPTQWFEGDRMEIDDGSGNILRVKATPVSNPISVKAGHNDTTDANAANGAAVLKNPEFEHDEILQAIQRTIDSLWPYAWVKDTASIAPVAGVHIYALPATFKELISAVQDVTPAATPTQFKVIRYGVDPGYPVSILRDLPATVSASGLALWFQSFNTVPGNSILVSHARLISATPAAGNFADVDDGLMADMIVHGACAVLLASLEIQRNVDDVAQGDAALAPGSRLRAGAWYQQRFEQLRWEYKLYLDRQEPRAGVWSR